MRGHISVRDTREMLIGFESEKLKGRFHLGDPDPNNGTM
jgi:hypothetical protein